MLNYIIIRRDKTGAYREMFGLPTCCIAIAVAMESNGPTEIAFGFSKLNLFLEGYDVNFLSYTQNQTV